MKLFLRYLVISVLLVSCSSVKQTTTSETIAEIKNIEVPVIKVGNIPGVFYRETPIEEFFTGEVIQGKIQDSTGYIIAEIEYRPLKTYPGKIRDTIGNFTAFFKPPPIKVTTSVTTNKTELKKEYSFFEKILKYFANCITIIAAFLLITWLLIWFKNLFRFNRKD